MEISTQQKETVSILKLTGELDASNAVVVDEELIQILEKKPSHIWVDGTEISYISSAGLGVFLSHLHTIQQQQIKFVFFGLNAKIKSVFNILGLDTLVQMADNLEELTANCKLDLQA